MLLFCQQGLSGSSEDGGMLLGQGHAGELEEYFSVTKRSLQLLSAVGEPSQELKPLRPGFCRQLCELGQFS